MQPLYSATTQAVVYTEARHVNVYVMAHNSVLFSACSMYDQFHRHIAQIPRNSSRKGKKQNKTKINHDIVAPIIRAKAGACNRHNKIDSAACLENTKKKKKLSGKTRRVKTQRAELILLRIVSTVVDS